MLSEPAFANTLSSSQSVKPQQNPDYSINLNDCIEDIADNLVYRTEFDDIPTDIYIPIVFELINDIIDDISTSPDKFIKPKHQKLIECYINTKYTILNVLDNKYQARFS